MLAQLSCRMFVFMHGSIGLDMFETWCATMAVCHIEIAVFVAARPYRCLVTSRCCGVCLSMHFFGLSRYKNSGFIEKLRIQESQGLQQRCPFCTESKSMCFGIFLQFPFEA